MFYSTQHRDEFIGFGLKLTHFQLFSDVHVKCSFCFFTSVNILSFKHVSSLRCLLLIQQWYSKICNDQTLVSTLMDQHGCNMFNVQANRVLIHSFNLTHLPKQQYVRCVFLLELQCHCLVGSLRVTV